jgi:hypothetical protein
MLGIFAVVKSSLIDLEFLPDKAGDNKGQAGNVQPDRLNKKTSKEDAIVESSWKHEEVAEMTTRLKVIYTFKV